MVGADVLVEPGAGFAAEGGFKRAIEDAVYTLLGQVEPGGGGGDGEAWIGLEEVC